MIKYCLLCVLIAFSSLSLAVSDQQNSLDTAKQYFLEKKYEDCEALLDSIIEQKIEIAEANFYLGRIYYERDDSKRAIRYFKKALKHNNTVDDYHYWLARGYTKKARQSSIMTATFIVDDIKESFLSALKINPKHIGALRGLAQFYLSAPEFMGGDIDKSIGYAEQLLVLDEKSGHDLFSQIYIQQRNTAKAIYHLEQLEQHYGALNDFYSFYNRYGYLLLRNNKTSAAIDKFKKQIELAPEDPNAYDSLGDGYQAAHQWQDALKAYEVALLLDPEFSLAKKNIKKIKKILSNHKKPK